MSCPVCGGCGWIEVTDHAGNNALKACRCRTAKISAEAGKPLTLEFIGVQFDALCGLLGFSPQNPLARAALIDLLMDMCATEGQLEWLVKRAGQIYTKWPGVPALRQILCSRFRPKDGIECSWSETFPDGLPDSKESPPALPALPPGHVASVDTDAERAVTVWSRESDRQWKGLPQLSAREEMRRREFDKELEAVITAPGERSLEPPVPVDLLLQEMSAYRAPDATDGRREISLLILERYKGSNCVRSFVEQERMVLGDGDVTTERKQFAERAVKRLG
jgi:hypothetical protein